MLMSSTYIPYKDSRLAYQKYEGGESCLFVFHGFGHTHLNMQEISFFFQKRGYTVYAFDLYFHGQSEWLYRGKPIQLTELQHIFSSFIAQEGIASFAVLAYSIGSRFAVSLGYLFSQNLSALYLIAPDAVKISPWYRFLTGNYFGKSIFRLVKNERAYKIALSVMSSLGFVNASTLRFVQNRMKNKEERNKIYTTWMAFRVLGIPFEHLAQRFNCEEVPFYLFLGKYDRLIPYQKLLKQMDYLHKKEVYLYSTGHNQLPYAKSFFDDLAILLTK